MKLWEKLKTTFRIVPPVNPAVYGDDLALRTEWTPISRSSFSVCSHRLRLDATDQSYRFETTLSSRFFFIFFYLFGATIVGMGIFLYAGGRGNEPSAPLCMAAGVGMIVLGGYLHCSFRKKIIFSRDLKAFFKLFGAIHRVVDPTRLDGYTPFREIGALQILEKQVRTKNGAYLCYELNLVRRDTTRVCVVAHGGYRQLAEDAAVLSGFLNVPLWNATAASKKERPGK